MFDSRHELKKIKEHMIAAGISEKEVETLLKPLEDELQRRICGLVWEHKDTSIPKMNGKLPAFIRQDDKCITGTGGTDNILIEGENLYALMGLQYTHIDDAGKGLIDVIYIDPPYNTESTDFSYNDRFEKSEWISLMDIRLRLGKNLMKEDGIIFISINDKFHSQLKLLCDDIFGASNFLADMIWRSTPGSNTGTDIKKVTEYVLCYEKCCGKASTGARKLINENSYFLEDEYIERRGRYKKNKLDRRMTGQHYSESLNYPISMPDGTELFPGGESYKQKYWNWRWSAEKVRWGKENGFIIFIQDDDTKKWSIYFKQYLKVDNADNIIERQHPYQNLIEGIDGVSSSTGSADLMKIANDKAFDYPKPLNLMKHLLGIHTNPDAIVLDFFAGSGTTGQAVLEMNAEYKWNRRFILCTNNEVRKTTKEALISKGVIEGSKEWEDNGICRSITLPRLKTVITGKRKDNSEYKRKMYELADILYERKISYNDIKKGKMDDINEEIEAVYRDMADDYDRIKVSLENDKIVIYGINKIKNIVEKITGNLYYYKIDDSPCECTTEEETIEQIIDKFISYVSIKEGCFEVIADESATLLHNFKGKEVMVITDTGLSIRDVKKLSRNKLSDNTPKKKVYCKVRIRETFNKIEFIPYPKEIMDVLTSRRKDIIK